MPPSLRARTSRSSRPYRRSSATSPVQTTEPLAALEQPANPDPDPVSPDPGTTPDASSSSEPTTPPDRPGLPTYAEYKRIEAGYLNSLSPRKRDKALIKQAMFDKVWDVLHQPDACTIETPQFRFWVRKMFRLSRPVWVTDEGNDGEIGRIVWTSQDGGDDSDSDTTEAAKEARAEAEAEAEAQDLALERAMGIGGSTEYPMAVVLHENRPVAIMEQLYELFCYCHVRAGHGGRDKTCSVIRQHYSWVPKELTAQFVKACPTCTIKRSGMGMGMMNVTTVSGAGSEMTAVVQKRTGKREKKTRTSGGASLDLVPWTGGGPLDAPGPAVEPGPARALLWYERERERQRTWFGVREDVLQSSPAASPTTSPYEHEHSVGFLPPSSHTPTRSGLPLVHLHLSPTAATTGPERPLPSTSMQPLRLLGPGAPGRPSGSPSSGSSSSSSAVSSWTSDGSPSHPHLQIDPVLLSFDYPGLVEWEDAVGSQWHTEESFVTVPCLPGTPSPPGEKRLNGLGLRTADDDRLGAHKGQIRRHKDVSERVDAVAASRSTPRLSSLSLSSSLSRSSPYGDRHRRVNSPLAMRYTPIQHLGCATDELGLGLGLGGVGQESDGTRSPLIITTDA